MLKEEGNYAKVNLNQEVSESQMYGQLKVALKYEFERDCRHSIRGLTLILLTVKWGFLEIGTIESRH